MFSLPERDKRRHSTSVVFRCIARNISELHSGDDARDVRWYELREALNATLMFDHMSMVRAYVTTFHPHLL